MTRTEDEQRAGQPVGRVENEKRGGRYGSAPRDAPHVAPEIEPARGADPDVHVAPGTPGMLPENEGRSPDDPVGGAPNNDVSGKNARVPRKQSEKAWEGARLRDEI